MSSEDLGILARIARALFPEQVSVHDEEVFMHLFPNFSPSSWRQRDGVWMATSLGRHIGSRIRGARLLTHVPGLEASPRVIRAAAEGVMPESATTRDILADPGVNAAMEDRWVVFRSGIVGMRTNEASAADMAELVRAIEVARRRPWEALAKKWALAIDGQALSIEGDTGGLRGGRESFDIRIREERRFTRIRVAMPPGLPADFRIRSGRPEPEQKINHPILDRTVICQGLNRDLRQRVRSLDEPLLHLLGERPESDIDHKRIRIVSPGRVLADLDSLVEAAFAVVRALRP